MVEAVAELILTPDVWLRHQSMSHRHVSVVQRNVEMIITSGPKVGA